MSSTAHTDYRTTSDKIHPHPMTARTVTRKAPVSHRSVTAWQLVAVAIVGALIGLWVSPGRAFADQIEPADTDVAQLRVTYVEPVGRAAIYVELNNGATYRFNPCRVEDGRRCYWDANSVGNMRGHSFIVLPGHRLVFSRMIGDAR